MKIFARAFYVILVLTILFSVSCKKNSKPAVIISPSDINIYAKGGDVIIFDVEVRSEKEALSKFTIISQPENYYKSTVLDTTISGNKFIHTYHYVVPDTLTQASVFFHFAAYDTDGDMGRSSRRLVLDTNPVVLTETAGHIFYSKFAGIGKPDAYDINMAAPQFSDIAATELLDIADFDTIPSDSALAKSWHSPAGNKFVRFPEFDYAKATVQSAKAAYESGTQLSRISGLKVDDIIITRVKDGQGSMYAVIKITKIEDAASVENDRYEFTLKK